MEELYELETVEQVRTIADDLRQRILEVLTERPMTATQVAERLGISPTRTHYHVRELERVGLVRLVETREKGGILEKYFQPVARNMVIPPSLVRRDRAGALAATADFMQDVMDRFLTAISRAEREEVEGRFLALNRLHIWCTRDEMAALLEKQMALFDEYLEPRCVDGEEERTAVSIVYPTLLGEEQTEPAPEARKVTAAGLLQYDRSQLQQFADADDRLAITVYGRCTFSDDVPADLVDSVVARFRLRGQLVASDEVRAVLSTKE